MNVMHILLSDRWLVFWCRALGAIILFGMFKLVLFSSGGIAGNGKPLGTDFTSFWAASKLALSGLPEFVYSVPVHRAIQNEIFGQIVPYSAFFYPPIYLLYCLPLALVPYVWSVAIWLGSTLLLYLHVVRKFCGKHIGLIPLLAFPGVYTTLGHGQNAFLTTALIGAAILCLDRRPILAGIFIGALAFKPHLGIVFPFALIAAQRWRTFFSAGATVAALALVSLMVFGLETWQGFIAGSSFATKALEQSLVGAHKMQSVFAAVRLLDGSVGLAYTLQAIVSLGVIATMMFVIWRRPGVDAQMPIIACAALLATPFLLDYDLLILALPLCWLLVQGKETGFREGEKLIGIAAFVLPLISRDIAGTHHIPLGPPVLLAVFFVLVNRSGAFEGVFENLARRWQKSPPTVSQPT